jgi:cell division protein FtsB
MREFEIKRKRTNLTSLIYNKVTVIFLLILIILMAKTLWNTSHKKKFSEAAVIKAKKELTELQKREEYLVSQIEYLKSPEGVEAELRERFRVGREGEEIAVILEEDKIEDQTIASTSPKRGFISRIFNFFR